VLSPIELPPAPDPDPFSDPFARALVAEVDERGSDASLDGVLDRSGATAEEFHRRFADFDSCLVDTYERFIASFERAVATAFNAHDEWRTALRAAAYAATDWMEASPDLMEFGAVGVLTTRNEMARVRREQVAAFCGALIERGRAAAPSPGLVPEAAALIAVGSILHLLTKRIQEDDEIDLAGTVPELMYGIVRTYLGEEEAREELTLPRP
jgi:hypothetical protein